MRIWFFLCGYVIIRIEGLSFEKLFNLAAQNGILLYDTVRPAYTTVELKLSAAHFRKLKKILPEKYSMRVLKKAGMPYIFLSIFARKALLVGLVLIAAAVGAASVYVWDIRVSGEDVDSYDIKKELETLGITTGMLKSKIDTKQLEQHFIIEHDDIAWIDASIKGVVLNIRVVPALPVPEIWDENTPCNIVATKDGYVTSVLALNGRAMVKEGDVVRKGDLLISGVIWDEGSDRLMFAARGEVLANVWYTGVVSEPLFKETREPTGAVQQQRVIVLGRDKAEIDPGCTFAEYDTKVVDEYFVGGRLFLPVKVVAMEHTEVKITKTPVALELLKVIAEEKAYNQAASKADEDAVILGHSTVFEISDSEITATVYLKTQQDIGKVVYIEE